MFLVGARASSVLAQQQRTRTQPQPMARPRPRAVQDTDNAPASAICDIIHKVAQQARLSPWHALHALQHHNAGPRAS